MSEETNKAPAKPTNIIQIERVTGGGGLFLFIFVVWWLAGIVLAKGFWSCLFAITMPPYAMYLLVERTMVMFGMV